MRSVYLRCCLIGLFCTLAEACTLLTPETEPRLVFRRREVLEQRTRLSPLDSDEPEPATRPQLTEELATTEATNQEPAQTTTPPPPSSEAVPPEAARTDDSTQAQRPLETADGGTSFSAADESVAALLLPTTPPHVAAALRCVEQGRNMLLQGRVQAAREWFERALALDGNNVYAYYFLARTALKSARLDQAEAFLSRALTLSGQASRTWQSRILSLRGEILEGVGRYPDARQAYREAAELDPSNVQARQGLARLSASQ